jgi:hypothetical protein
LPAKDGIVVLEIMLQAQLLREMQEEARLAALQTEMRGWLYHYQSINLIANHT